MISALKVAYRFFKMWFLPMPPHDYYAALEREAESGKAEKPDADSSAAGEPREPLRIETEEVYKTANAAAARSESEITPENNEIEAVSNPIQNSQGPDFSHLVKPPEGSEARASRGAADSPSDAEDLPLQAEPPTPSDDSDAPINPPAESDIPDEETL